MIIFRWGFSKGKGIIGPASPRSRITMDEVVWDMPAAGPETDDGAVVATVSSHLYSLPRPLLPPKLKS